MSAPQTEKMHAQAHGLDEASDDAILSILHRAQVDAAEAVGAAMPDLARGADAMVRAIKSGGNLVYAAAGSSGLMALADGLEIPPTFGIPNSRIKILMAGGLDDVVTPKGGAEDDTKAAAKDASVIGANDCVICVAASGNTPYTVKVMEISNKLGATTIGMSNNDPGKLLSGADIAIHLPTPPEVVAGSTRLGAGTAQKIAMNMMSTLMGVRLGHVMNGMMVNLVANNIKLLRRAENIVIAIADCDQTTAAICLKKTDGNVKEAILLAAGATDLTQANDLLEDAGQNMRAAIMGLKAG